MEGAAIFQRPSDWPDTIFFLRGLQSIDNFKVQSDDNYAHPDA